MLRIPHVLPISSSKTPIRATAIESPFTLLETIIDKNDGLCSSYYAPASTAARGVTPSMLTAAARFGKGLSR